jgi:MraZ protein
MFLSSFEGIIDSKNRISIPSSLRTTILQSKEKIYLFRSLKYSCLEVHLASKINALIKSFDEKDFFSKKNDHFKTAILSDLEEITIDKDGRFTLRDSHKIFSKIKKEIIFIGKEITLKFGKKI